MSAMVWNVDPEIFRIGSYALRWYSLLFAGGFVAAHHLATGMWKSEGRDVRELDAVLLYTIIGTIVGARLAHCLFYDPAHYLQNPLEILKVWTGGLASHGGFTGVFIALWLIVRRFRTIGFLELVDRIIVPTALVASLIRVGNLFNSEIIGHPTDLPWAVVFAKIDQLPRHPSQVYEAIGYAICLGALLHFFYRTTMKTRPGVMLGWALAMSTVIRFSVEFLKENQSAFEDGLVLNMGQILSIPFFMIGVALIMGMQAKLPQSWLTAPAAATPRAAVQLTQVDVEAKSAARKAARKRAQKSA